ncbi:hypothetical protein NXS19_004779 [Fusarium pseudograminearum]|nr:hypothetical protein NXS19_004779 [Fusarium pseudograminearum]
MEGELELATESHFATNKHTQCIGEIISHLYRFTSIVKEQHVDAEDQRINQWVLGEGQKLEHQLEGLELYISYSLDRDFPTLQPFLRNRLIHTVMHRRRRLLYQEDCSVKLDSSLRDPTNSKRKEKELASEHQDVQDIRPYICLFQNCITPLQQFAIKDDWINHMSSQHAQVWVCQVKGHETWRFQNLADLETHLQDEHSDIVDTDQITFLAAKSARASLDILAALATEKMPENSERLSVCPFCNLSALVFEPKSQLAAPGHGPTAETSTETHQKAHDHISAHLQLIAHESLPPTIQTPRSVSLRSFKIAIICKSPLITRSVSQLFNESSNMEHLFQKRIEGVNAYSLAAIGRHSVILVQIAEMSEADQETLFSVIGRSFPYIKLFMLVDLYPISTSHSNIQINFGDVIVGDRVQGSNSKRNLRHPYYSNVRYKPGARLRSLLAKMRTPQVRKMVQQRMSTGIEVLEKYRSLTATYRSTGYRKSATQRPRRGKDHKMVFYTDMPERQSNGAPKPRFHLGAIENRTSPLTLQSSRSTVTVADSHDLDFGTDKIGESLELFPHLLIQTTCENRANWQDSEQDRYAATTAAAFMTAILDLWPSMSSMETTAIYDPVYHIPIPKNKDFVERKTSMKALRDKLFRDDTEQVTIYGSDGNGKTQLALRLAYWVKDSMPNYSVFWAAAMSKDAFEQDCHQIVKSLGYRCTGGNDPKVVLQRYLSSDSSGRWILILDEASNEDLTYGQCEHPFEISKFLPNSRKGRILVTTESKEVAWVGDAVVTLSYMNDEESLNLLSRSLINKSHDETLMKELLQIIPSHPPVISMAAAYININKVTIGSYLGLLKDAKRSVNTLLDISDTKLGLCNAFNVAFEHIEKHHNLAAKILVFLSFFKPNTIRSELLPGTENAQEFKAAIHTLCEYEFVTKRYNTTMFDIRRYNHRATQLWVKDRDVADQYRGAVAAHLVQILTPDDSETRQLWNQLLQDVWNLVTYAKHFHRDTSNLGCLVVRYLHQNGHVARAIRVFERLLDSQSGALSEDEAYYLTLQFELAGLYRSNSQTQKAIDLLERVVAARDRTLEESNPDRLESQTELAGVYQENGQHEQATKILEHLAAVRKRIDSEDSPDLLELQHQLANAYLSTDRLDEGNKLLEHVNAVKGRSSWDVHSEQEI